VQFVNNTKINKKKRILALNRNPVTVTNTLSRTLFLQTDYYKLKYAQPHKFKHSLLLDIFIRYYSG